MKQHSFNFVPNIQFECCENQRLLNNYPITSIIINNYTVIMMYYIIIMNYCHQETNSNYSLIHSFMV